MKNDKIKKYVIPIFIGFIVSLLVILIAFYSNNQEQVFISNIGGYVIVSFVVGCVLSIIYNAKTKHDKMVLQQRRESEKAEQDTQVSAYNQDLFYSGKTANNTSTSISSGKTLAEIELEKVDGMSVNGYEFEKYVTELLGKHGYKTETTQASNDSGVDVIAINKDGVRYAIQCKCYSSSVGISAVQEVSAGMNIYNCQVAVVITNNYFTPAAKSLAEANKVLLWDRDTLKKLIKER